VDAGYADCLNALSREIPFKAYQSLAATTEFTPRIRTAWFLYWHGHGSADVDPAEKAGDLRL